MNKNEFNKIESKGSWNVNIDIYILGNQYSGTDLYNMNDKPAKELYDKICNDFYNNNYTSEEFSIESTKENGFAIRGHQAGEIMQGLYELSFESEFDGDIKSFEELSIDTQKQIINSMKEGKTSGEITETLIDFNDKLYHATNHEFIDFSVDKIQKYPGFWFTEDIDYAKQFGNKLLNANLDIKNPFNVENNKHQDMFTDFYNECFPNVSQYDESLIYNSPVFRDYLISKGFDAMIWEHSGSLTVVAFYPEQIKNIEIVKEKSMTLDDKLAQAASMRNENNNVSKDTKNKDLEI